MFFVSYTLNHGDNNLTDHWLVVETAKDAAIRQKEIERMDAQQARAKMAALLGHGWQGDFSEATGIHRVSLSKQLIGDRIPDSIAGHIEWLCSTPTAKWPERWQKLVARAKAHAAKSKAA